MRFVSGLLVVVFSGCAPTLYLTRPTPPEGNFGTVHTMPVVVTTDMARNAENAVVNGLAFGQLPVPVQVDELVKERFALRLQQLGYAVCPASPCGDGEMTVNLIESVVNTEFTGNGLRANVRLKARVVVKQQDGQTPFDWTFWNSRSGDVMAAPMLVRDTADHLAANMANTLMPGREKSELPLEDGGKLSAGVNMLLSSQWDGAINYFTQLTQQEPDNAAAWYDLGVAWEAYGDWGQALTAYEQAAARARKSTYLDAVEAARRRAPARPTGPVPPPQPIPTN